MTHSLQDLVNSAIFMSTEAQMRFEQRVAPIVEDWDADFSDEPSLAFGTSGDEASRIELRPHLIGSADSAYGTWRWGWSEDNSWPQPLVNLSYEVRKFGAAQGLAEFSEHEFKADDEDSLRLTLAAKVATGRWTHFPLPYGTTQVWLLVDEVGALTSEQAGEPSIRSIVKAIAAGISLTEVTDHGEALRSYSRLRGFPLVELPDGKLRVLAADGSADVTFDDKHRLTNCQVHQPLEGEAADQFAAAGPHSLQSAPPVSPATPAPSTEASPHNETIVSHTPESESAASQSTALYPTEPLTHASNVAPSAEANPLHDVPTTDGGVPVAESDAPSAAPSSENDDAAYVFSDAGIEPSSDADASTHAEPVGENQDSADDPSTPAGDLSGSTGDPGDPAAESSVATAHEHSSDENLEDLPTTDGPVEVPRTSVSEVNDPAEDSTHTATGAANGNEPLVFDDADLISEDAPNPASADSTDTASPSNAPTSTGAAPISTNDADAPTSDAPAPAGDTPAPNPALIDAEGTDPDLAKDTEPSPEPREAAKPSDAPKEKKGLFKRLFGR